MSNVDGAEDADVEDFELAEDDPGIYGELDQTEPEEIPSPVEQVEAGDAREEDPDGEAERDDDPSAVATSDEEELEYEGVKFKAPAGSGIKEALLRQADYTRKTQEVAEKRRQTEAFYAEVNKQAQYVAEELDLRADYVSIRKELAGYDNVDWDAAYAQDPQQAGRAAFHVQQLKDRLAEVGGKIEQTHTNRVTEAQRLSEENTLQRLRETEEWAKKSIPAWTPKTNEEVIGFAIEQGIAFEDIRSAMNPKIYNILRLARIGAAVEKAPKPKPGKIVPNGQRTELKPTKTVGGKGAVTGPKSLASMNMDEYARYRAAQEKRAAG